MFLKHTTAFDTFAPVTTAPSAAPGFSLTTSGETMLETPRGWRALDDLKAGDQVATFDGGFAEITGISAAPATPMIEVPGGTLSACSDLALPADTHVVLELPELLPDTALVSVPVKALCGWHGIRPRFVTPTELCQLAFADEELIFAQTGLLLHAAPTEGDSYFTRMGYGETRALLGLSDDRLRIAHAA